MIKYVCTYTLRVYFQKWIGDLMNEAVTLVASSNLFPYGCFISTQNSKISE